MYLEKNSKAHTGQFRERCASMAPDVVSTRVGEKIAAAGPDSPWPLNEPSTAIQIFRHHPQESELIGDEPSVHVRCGHVQFDFPVHKLKEALGLSEVDVCLIFQALCRYVHVENVGNLVAEFLRTNFRKR